MWRYNRLQEVYRSKYFTSFPPGSLPSFDAASKQCKKYIYLINHAQKHSSREEVIYRSVYERTLGKRQLNKMVQHDFASDSLCWWYLVFWLAMLIFFLYHWLFFTIFFVLVHFDYDKLGWMDKEKYAVYCDKSILSSLVNEGFIRHHC